MTESERLAHDLGEWFADTANPHVPAYVDDILRATAGHRQRPRWSFIGRPIDPTSHPARPTARAVLVGLVLALLMAVLLAALLIPLSGSRQADPVKPRLGPDIPDGAAEGIIETPLGRARWVHLRGDTSTLPQEPSWWPTTWASFVGDAPFTHLDLEAGFRWTSNDGMRWDREPIIQPIEADMVLPHDGGGARWLLASGPPGIWRSTDGRSWRPIDLESILPASPAAVEWEVEPSFEMASTDTATVTVVTARATEPFATLEWPQYPEPGQVSEREPGLIVFAGSEAWETPDRYLRFEATPDGMRVIEVADDRR